MFFSQDHFGQRRFVYAAEMMALFWDLPMKSLKQGEHLPALPCAYMEEQQHRPHREQSRVGLSDHRNDIKSDAAQKVELVVGFKKFAEVAARERRLKQGLRYANRVRIS